MNRDAAAAEATPWRLLAPSAVGHLAHDLRGSIHVIRGHAELLGAELPGAEATAAEVRESANYIVAASMRLGSVCEDVIDFLRLPNLALGEPALFVLDDVSLFVHPTARRVAMHVIEHAVRSAADSVTVAATLDASAASCAITISPLPPGVDEREDGIIALAAELLVACGSQLATDGGTLRIDLRGVGKQ